MDFVKAIFTRKTPEQRMKEHKRGLDRTCRELDRERVKLECAEKKLIIEMKKAANQNQIAAVRIMAQDLVRSRRYSQRFRAMKAQLQAVSLRMTTMQSTAQLSQAMSQVTRAMHQMNSQVNLTGMQNTMREFDRQNQMMCMKEEIISDQMDLEEEEDDDEDQSDLEVRKVLDELCLGIGEKIRVTTKPTPTTVTPTTSATEEEDEEADRQLMVRFNALKAESSE